MSAESECDALSVEMVACGLYAVRPDDALQIAVGIMNDAV